MHFGFGEDALLLQKTVRDFLRAEHGADRVRAAWDTETGRSADLWRKLADVGLAGALVPDAHGGMGLDETFGVLLLEECGRAAVAEPVVATAAVGAPLLAELGDAELAARWLPKVAAGEALLAVGHRDVPFMSDAHVADLLLLPDAAGDLHAVPRDGAKLTAQPANDPSQKLFAVEFAGSDATRVAEGARAAGLLAAAFDRGALACAAELVGVAEQLVEMAVAYTSQRKQFGRPIGSFQAVKHALANVKVRLEYARPLVYRAAYSVANGDARRALHVAMAKAEAGEAATLAARAALQAHGAIGYTFEQDLHIWMRRAWSLDLAWGARRLHRERIAAAVLAPGTPIGPGTTF
ncbi:MAG TPA: acyl-CoA dehydrogenase family protein [Myxococcota bacterium]|nr:acyl-CoA dehydrogenase family protein [Myxococcota bacterium]